MGVVQSAIYFVVAVLLIVATLFTCVGTVVDLVEGRDSRPIADAGLFVLEMAGLGGLALVLIASIYLLRRSAAVAGAQPRAA